MISIYFATFQNSFKLYFTYLSFRLLEYSKSNKILPSFLDVGLLIATLVFIEHLR